MKKKIACFLLCCLYLACNEPAIVEDNKPLPVVKNGDVTIAYHLSGKADTALVFVHGWCINKEYWKAQQDYFDKRFKVVTVDMGGHGESDHNRSSWTVNDFANDVAAVIDSLQLQKVILIGHSMGGEVILETALKMPGKIVGFIGIDNLNDFKSSFSAEEKKGMNDFIAAMHKDYKNTAGAFSKANLFPENYADTVSVNRVIKDIENADTAVAIAALSGLIDYSQGEGERMAQLPLPLHLIMADRTPVNDSTLTLYCKKGYYVKKIDGIGHYPMIEKPGLFNTMLEQTVNEIAAGK